MKTEITEFRSLSGCFCTVWIILLSCRLRYSKVVITSREPASIVGRPSRFSALIISFPGISLGESSQVVVWRHGWFFIERASQAIKTAGLQQKDFIIQCNGKYVSTVYSCSKYWRRMLEKWWRLLLSRPMTASVFLHVETLGTSINGRYNNILPL